MGPGQSWRPSPPLVISMLALFVSLSGSAVALSGQDNIDHNDLQRHVVHRGKIHSQAVNTNKVKDESLGAIDLAPDSVGASEIAANAVGASEIAANAVGLNEIAANSVGQSEIVANGVGANEVASNAVGTPEIASNAVASSKIANGAVTVSKLNAVTGVVNLNFPEVDSHDCQEFAFPPLAPGVTEFDNIILTPDFSASHHLIWSVRQPPGIAEGTLPVSVCNPTDGAINPPSTALRYLAIHP